MKNKASKELTREMLEMHEKIYQCFGKISFILGFIDGDSELETEEVEIVLRDAHKKVLVLLGDYYFNKRIEEETRTDNEN